MGTRHFIGVVIDGDFKVAQYGQWDGYPSGQGATIHDFLEKLEDYGKFKEQVRKCRWITPEMIDTVNKDPNWSSNYPWLSRDAGAKILEYVNDASDGLDLQDNRSFAGDSLFCEFAYVLDLDNDALEVYRGFNHKPTPADSRFPSGADWLEKSGSMNEYEPVSMIKKYDLKELLPSLDDFVAELENLVYPDSEDD